MTISISKVAAKGYTYASILKDAAKVNWQVTDLISKDRPLDFTKPFLSERLAHTHSINCLNALEKLRLNQIRGNSYLHLFGVVEEFILPLVVSHASSLGCEEIEATQAYLGFAAEESKHIRLFRQFAAAFKEGFDSRCDGIGPAQAIADFVSQHRPLGIALMTLHIEWMTQRHFIETVRDNAQESLDPQFCRLLRYHWQEEAQHARLDTLMVQSMSQGLTPDEIDAGVDDYLAIVDYLKSGLTNQGQLDIASLERATNRSFSTGERRAIEQRQAYSYNQTFLVSGMTHPCFIESLQALSPSSYPKVAQAAQALSILS